MKKYFSAILVLCSVLLVLSLIPSCDNAQANPYKELYEQEVTITDSLTQAIDNLREINQHIYAASISKIDSLKSVIVSKNILIAQRDTIITMLNQLPAQIQNDLENLTDEAIQNLINIQKR